MHICVCIYRQHMHGMAVNICRDPYIHLHVCVLHSPICMIGHVSIHSYASTHTHMHTRTHAHANRYHLHSLYRSCEQMRAKLEHRRGGESPSLLLIKTSKQVSVCVCVCVCVCV